ncbi:hypothetical protein C8F01DRAFT_1119058 [Mycena amicta]|nr:hypothetical protein C8F01DRAFT_1119058 [Mycena amicta]
MLTRSRGRELESRVMATTHPLVSFPVEITTEIFLYCLPEVVDFMDPNVAPRLLMRICRRWRQIVLSLPKLWTSFRININQRLWQDELTACLQRSASLPLDVVLFSEHGHYINHEQLLMFPQYCNRIQHLKVDMPVDILGDLDEAWLLKHPRVQFPALQHLVLPEVSHLDDQIMWLEDYYIRGSTSQESRYTVSPFPERTLFGSMESSTPSRNGSSFSARCRILQIAPSICTWKSTSRTTIRRQRLLLPTLPSRTYSFKLLLCTPLIQRSISSPY